MTKDVANGEANRISGLDSHCLRISSSSEGALVTANIVVANIIEWAVAGRGRQCAHVFVRFCDLSIDDESFKVVIFIWKTNKCMSQITVRVRTLLTSQGLWQGGYQR